MSIPADDTAQLFVDPQEHLELVRGARHVAPVDQIERLPHHRLVVRRDPHAAPPVERLFQEPAEIAVDDPPVAVGDLSRLHIDPLAEPHAGPFRQGPQIGETPAHVGLQYDADVIETLVAQAAVEFERRRGAARIARAVRAGSRRCLRCPEGRP